MKSYVIVSEFPSYTLLIFIEIEKSYTARVHFGNWSFLWYDSNKLF